MNYILLESGEYSDYIVDGLLVVPDDWTIDRVRALQHEWQKQRNENLEALRRERAAFFASKGIGDNWPLGGRSEGYEDAFREWYNSHPAQYYGDNPERIDFLLKNIPGSSLLEYHSLHRHD